MDPSHPAELSVSYQAMQAADLALVASGTATLEAALHGLPNLLLNRDLVVELIQQDCEPVSLVSALRSLAEDQARQHQMREAFADLHDQLARGCADRVAQALGVLL